MSERVCYHTGESTKSYEVCKRVAESTGFRLEHVKNYELGTAPIVYGLFRGTEVAMRTAYWSNLPFFYIDHGYFNFMHYDGYYRVVKNGVCHTAVIVSNPVTQSQECLPFGEPGPFTVICKPNLQGSIFLPFVKVWPEEWVDGLTHSLQSMGHKVVVSDKNTNKVADMPKQDIRLVIGHESAIVAASLLRGIRAMNWSYGSRRLSMMDATIAEWENHRRYHLSMLEKSQFKLADLTMEHFT